jgi:hypothetical protein
MSANDLVKLDLTGLRNFEATIKGQLSGTGAGPVAVAVRQWGIVYRSYVQERYDKFSKGGGDWPDLAESTKRKRRKGKPKKGAGGEKVAEKYSILRDIGLLFNVLSPVFASAPGAIQEDIPFGVKVGFGGPSAHPGSKATIADIASFHQYGAGVPKREIIVAPSVAVVAQMSDLMQAALTKLAGQDDA